MRLPLYAPIDSKPGAAGEVTRADVVAEARSWLGTPYVHQHREKGIAVDCAGLVIGVGRELGIFERGFDVNAYARKPDGVSMREACLRYMTPVLEQDVKPGHVLLIAFRRDPQHLGILGDYLHGGFSLIHAYGATDGKGRVEEWHLTADRKGFRPMQAFALPGVR